MPGRRVLVTGGAGFVGSNVAIGLAERHPDWEVIAFDSLKRRGSELNLPRLRAAGVRFEHGDVRALDDLLALGRCDALVECSAEPSALAGVDGETSFVVGSNLVGAYHCLEVARRHGAQFVFLSTSRVYPVAAQEQIATVETETRFEIAPGRQPDGVSERGISEHFGMAGARTLYGATKLAAEHLVEEYAAAFGLSTVVDRCGVIAGPWQMGKVDQGVFTHWVLSHHVGNPLRYIGWGGTGKQVRDLLHVEDLIDLLDDQLARPEHWAGFVGNVGGGREISLSLLETTELCRELTGREVPVTPANEDRPGDVRVYLSDCAHLFSKTDWRPRRGARQILQDIATWIEQNDAQIRTALGGE